MGTLGFDQVIYAHDLTGLKSGTDPDQPTIDFDLCRTVVELTQLPSVKGLFVKDAGNSGGGVYN